MCVCVSFYAPVTCRCPQRPKGDRSPGSGFAGSCELLDMGAGKHLVGGVLLPTMPSPQYWYITGQTGKGNTNALILLMENESRPSSVSGFF